VNTHISHPQRNVVRVNVVMTIERKSVIVFLIFPISILIFGIPFVLLAIEAKITLPVVERRTALTATFRVHKPYHIH